eukprot:Hpha_TRINITY_DN12086_c0_g1::TRINITY_DN12086_c0_g1_i1::g.141196::m.141196
MMGGRLVASSSTIFVLFVVSYVSLAKAHDLGLPVRVRCSDLNTTGLCGTLPDICGWCHTSTGGACYKKRDAYCCGDSAVCSTSEGCCSSPYGQGQQEAFCYDNTTEQCCQGVFPQSCPRVGATCCATGGAPGNIVCCGGGKQCVSGACCADVVECGQFGKCCSDMCVNNTCMLPP